MDGKKALMASTLLLLAVTLGLTLAMSVVDGSSERIVGVKVGDWVKYGNFLATWSYSDDTPAAVREPPVELIEHNNTEWVKNTVTNVNETEIAFETVTHYKNGSETTSSLYVDINTGGGNGTYMFVSANLSQGESIYSATEYASTLINKTVQLVYSNAFRKTNYLAITTSGYTQDGTIQGVVYKMEYFWDKATGVMTKRVGTFITTSAEYTLVAVTSELVADTNVWKENPDTTPPTAEAGPDQIANVDQKVSFSAGGSIDNEGGWGIASYEWDFDDGTQGNGITITHTFNTPGNYTVTLTVEDWAGNSDEDTLTVTVQEGSSSPILGVVILAVLIVAGLLLWKLMTKK